MPCVSCGYFDIQEVGSNFMKYTPQSVNEKGRLTTEQAEAAALALNAGFLSGGVEANIDAFVKLVRLARA